MAVTLEQIYADYETLSKIGKDEFAKNVSVYKNFLRALKGGPQERRLAAQFLSKFLPNYPELTDEVVNNLIDLLENEDVAIRKQGVVELTSCCKTNPSLCAKVSDVFTQLLVTVDAAERTLLSNSLLTLFKLDSKGTLAGIFTQIIQGDDEVRHNSIKFVSQRLISLPADTWKGEVGDQMVEFCNKTLMGDCALDEFVGIVKVMANMPSLSSLTGRQQLVETIAEAAQLTQTFDLNDKVAVIRIMQCTKQALTLFSKNVPSNRFAIYVILNVIPKLNLTEPSEDDIEFVKLGADLTTYLGPVANEQLTQLLDVVFNAVVGHIATPPVTANDSAENSDPQTETDEKLNFTMAECLLYLLHKLAAKMPTYLDNDKVATMKSRLQYYAQRNQLVMKRLRAALQGKKASEIDADESLQQKQLALRTTVNIHSLIIDLLHVPPHFKAHITLSWRQTAQDNNDEKPSGKHQHSENGHDNPKRAKFQQQNQRSAGHGGRAWRGGNRGGRRF